MSKAEKLTRANTSPQLRKSLSEATKVLQSVTSSLEKIETSFADSESALSNERTLKERISGLEKEVAVLREENGIVGSQSRQEIAFFADTAEKLVKEFETRSSEAAKKHESGLKDLQRQIDIQAESWHQKVETEKLNTIHVKNSQTQSLREAENRLQKAIEDCKKLEEKFKVALQENKRQVTELQKTNQTLTRELSTHKTILTGRDMEIELHRSKLASLQTFSTEDSTDKIFNIINKLQKRWQDFCLYCVGNAETLPGWNHFPDCIRYKDLPHVYSRESDAGRYILAAAVQHSICAELKQNVFVPFGPCAGPESRDIANALYRDNQSDEAIWRLMTVNVILRDQEIQNSSKMKLHEIADGLLTSWDLFFGEKQRFEVRNMMRELLVDSANIWLGLMRVENRIKASVNVDSQYFDSDSGEELYNVPGDMKLSDSTDPVLCLFPAFFWHDTPDATARPKPIKKGVAMFRDSPPLVVALKEEREVSSSPRTSYRKMTAV